MITAAVLIVLGVALAGASAAPFLQRPRAAGLAVLAVGYVSFGAGLLLVAQHVIR